MDDDIDYDVSSRDLSSSKTCKYKKNIEDDNNDSKDISEIIEKDPLFESSTCKENSNIAESTESRNEDSTSKSQTHQSSSVTHKDVPKRIINNEEEEENLEHDLDMFTSNTMTKNTDIDNDEQDFAKSNVNNDDDNGSDELHLESQICQLSSVIYKDIPKRIMKKKVNDKEEKKDDNTE
ncbi:hypothetical protein RclHR1_24560002 [Rhizophagus clarus]|uniref:Uncharacterized protein n=1 Tax=Rhizophagus clarus TaxID=94130 RepID=A0A2Z6RAR5_9GLOM|nr:hypothetical protein RclHR1_24560002 [Rhizophagus clarus]